jgi:uncharacterized caspase-like protein
LVSSAVLLLPGPSFAQGVFGALEEERLAGDDEKGKRRALLIGIDTYDDPAFGPLAYASNDAIELGKTLLDATYGGFESVQVITNGELTARNLVARLKEWSETIAPEDLALVYFSGHGTRWVDERNRSHVFLAAQDTKKESPLDTAIPLAAMQEFMAALPTQRRVLIVDACFTGVGKVDSQDVNAAAQATIDERRPFRDSTSGKDAQLFATTYGRPALEERTREHGVYTFHLIEALKERFDAADVNGDRVVSVSEAHDWARDQTLDATSEVQVPMAFYRIVGREDLILSGSASNRERAQLAMITSYSKPSQGLVLVIDGEVKGAFPRTILVEPGSHAIEFRNLKGRGIDAGRIRLDPEKSYDVARIRDELNGGRHQIAVGYAHTFLPGEAVELEPAPQAFGGRLGYTFRFPSKSAFLRRLGLGVDLTLGVFAATEAQNLNGPLEIPTTVLLEVGVGPVLRLDLPYFMLAMQPRVAIVNLFRTEEAADVQNWIFVSGGADFIVGARPHNRLSIQLRYAPMLFNADLSNSGGAKLSLMHRLVGGVEFGF